MFSSIFFDHYKSFSSEETIELTNLKHVNVIIGKNNSGKSSVLDIINAASDVTYFEDNKERFGNIGAEFIVQPEYLLLFKDYSRIGHLVNPYDFAKNEMVGKPFRVDLNSQKRAYDNNSTFDYKYSLNQKETVFKSDIFDVQYSDATSNLFNKVALKILTLNNIIFRRLSAERNISPENETQNEELDIDGVGASNLVRKFLNFSEYDETIIETHLLNALNKIMVPEAEFENIRVQEIEKGGDLLWEIFLQEKGCGRFPLSHSGSGLKTIILLLLNLLVIPKTNAYNGKKIIFGFEEIENNLHPALQRKVFEYIYEYAVNKDTYIFLTTHSHIAINTFYEKVEAQIYHIFKKNNVSTINTIDNYIDEQTVLEDLEIRASDLLQSNGIIWVEGPSDRIYIKRWLEVLCDCKYSEGKHYQFLYYGGKLLSHYTAHETDELIGILTTNRNAIIVIDSDKKTQQTPINPTKKRIVQEFNEYKMLSWITKGKEIENYLPASAIAECLGKTVHKQCTQFQRFPEYIKRYYSNFTSKKVAFANEIKMCINKENSSVILDLDKQIKKIYHQIQIWNK